MATWLGEAHGLVMLLHVCYRIYWKVTDKHLAQYMLNVYHET